MFKKIWISLVFILFSSSSFSDYVAPPYSIPLGGTGQTTQQAALDALAGGSTTTNNVLCYNGTHWVSCSPGGGSSIPVYRWVLEDATVLYTHFDGSHLVQTTQTISSCLMSMNNSGSSGSTTVQIEQWRSGSLQATATIALPSSSGAVSGASESLSGSLSLLSGDIIFMNVTGAPGGTPEGLTVECALN